MEKRNTGNIKPRFSNYPKKDNIDAVFGTRAVIEAIKAGKEIDRILVQRELRNPLIIELLATAEEFNIPVVKVPLDKLNQITRKNHQGVVSFIAAIKYQRLDDIIHATYEKGESPFVLVLDRITDVRNFGAISRTAECAGVHAIVIPEKGAAQINNDAVKTSSGALNHIPVCREKNLLQTIKYLQEYGLEVIACTEKAEKSLYEADLHGPVAIVMGSEEDGINDEYIRKADQLVKIPMKGQIGSLNVSVATGIALYECIRQRLGNG